MTSPEAAGTRVQAALAALRLGGMVVVADDEDRENEGDLIAAAQLVTPGRRGVHGPPRLRIVCVAMEQARLAELGLPLMTDDGTEAMGTAFTLSVDARDGTTTGVSAADRARTIAALVDAATSPHDLRRPGHLFPLRSKPGGVLERAGHTEASLDLARLAGLYPAGFSASSSTTTAR